MTTQDLNAAVARLLYPVHTGGLVSMLAETDNYAHDLNAAFEACLRLGYWPYLDPSSWYFDVYIRKDGKQWAGENCLIRKDLLPHEITQAIATALCEALVEAEGQADDT